MKIDNMSKTPRSYAVLVLGYFLFSGLWLIILINNALSELTGNRTVLALSIFLYLAIMCYGLIKWRRMFSRISALNFLAGSTISGLFLLSIFPTANVFLLIAFILGLSGLYLSLKSARITNKL